MKKTLFDKPAYSIAMSQETGCIVMVRTSPLGDVRMVGTLDRSETIKFAQSVLAWIPMAAQA